MPIKVLFLATFLAFICQIEVSESNLDDDATCSSPESGEDQVSTRLFVSEGGWQVFIKWIPNLELVSTYVTKEKLSVIF
jgi:hypothetical protein